MVREYLFKDNSGFRWRGGDVTRLENFSDAVFAFAITLLVVSNEVPKTFEDLLEVTRGFISFGLCFAFLGYLWYIHYIFFRRYGFKNVPVIWMNGFLLFLVMFYLYPMKFLATFIINMAMGINHVVNEINGEKILIIQGQDMPTLMLIYSLGIFAVFGMFTLMYYYAFRKRESLRLNEIEILITKGSITSLLIMVFVSLISISLIYIAPPYSGLIYFLIGPLQGVFGYLYGKKVSKMKQLLD